MSMPRISATLVTATLFAFGCADSDSNPTLGSIDASGLTDLVSGDTTADTSPQPDTHDGAGALDADSSAPPDVASDTPTVEDVPAVEDIPTTDASVDVPGDAQEETTDATTVGDLPDGVQSDGGIGDVAPTDGETQDAPSGDVTADVVPDLAPPDVAPDVGGTDVGADAPSSDVSAGCPDNPECFLPDPGSPDAPINQPAGVAPTLNGGAKPEGWYALDEIDIYTDGTFNGFVTSVQVASNGNTFGAIEVNGDVWGISANLDMSLTVQPLFGDPISQSFGFNLTGGGCFTIDGASIEADLLQCGGSFANGVAPPGSFPYETGNGALSVMIVIDQETILSLLPAEYQNLAGLALSGDLPMVLRFSAP